MSDRGATSGDFGFQPSDQAGGGSQPHPPQLYGGYNAELDANAPGAPDAANHTYVPGAAIDHHDYSAQRHQVAPGQFTGLGFSPSAPSGWDWTSSIDFSEFTNQYEPQGERAHEYQSHKTTTNDFSTPLPVTTGEAAYHAFQQNQSATPTPNATQTQNPLSPPPPRPQQQKPAVQTGMKRKLDSEPGSAVSQAGSAAAENASKRQHKSRQSSDASASSPPTARAAAPPAPSEAASRPTAHDGTQTGRRKEQSKGTGPQGRVIDVATPRRVPGSPGGLDTLPAGKVFPIQIGSELFRLSGASLSSDGKHALEA
jgi:hypothetical protein